MEVLPLQYSGYEHAADETLITTYATIAGSFLGLIGAGVLIVTSLSSPVRAMSKRIIIVISFADLMQALPTFVVACMHLEAHLTDLKVELSNLECKWQSYFITSGAMLMFLWTFGLSQHMYMLVRFGVKVAHSFYLSLYLLSLVPFALNIVAFVYDILGIDDQYVVTDLDGSTGRHQTNWCWIRVTNSTKSSSHNDSVPYLARSCPAALWAGKGFEIFSYVGVTVYSILAYCHMRSLHSHYERLHGSNHDGDSDDVPPPGDRVNRMLLMPILFIGVRIWGTIARLSCYCFTTGVADTICYSSFLQIMENFCDPLQGFVNLIIYKLLIYRTPGDQGTAGGCCPCLSPEALARLRGRRSTATVSREPVTQWRELTSSEDSFY